MTYIEDLLIILDTEITPLMRRVINDRSKLFLEALAPAAEIFLRHELDIEKYQVEEVKTLIQCVPGALLIRNEDGMYPIQSITWDYSKDGFNSKAIPFLPLLAEEGAKLNLGGDEMRGGLLIKQDDDVESECILEELVSIHQCEKDHKVESKRKKIEDICLRAIKELREKRLFLKEDIGRYNLLLKTNHPYSTDRFAYLSEWCPEARIQLMNIEENCASLRNDNKNVEKKLSHSRR